MKVGAFLLYFGNFLDILRFNKAHMRKLSFLIAIAILIPVLSFSQDIITLRNGKKIEAVVSEVNKKDVTYRKFSNPKGPLYRAELKDIGRINYESGAVDEFNPIQGEAASPKLSSNTQNSFGDSFGRNLISIDAMSLLFQNIEISYERFIGTRGKLGIRVPVSVNMNSGDFNNGFANARNVFNSGFDVNYYPLGQGVSRMFIGPSLRLGAARTTYSYFDNVIGGEVSTTGNSNYFAFLLRFGFLYTPVEELSIGTAFGIGTRRYVTNIPNQTAGSAVSLQFSLGYRF
jgi:hypothetical protein